MQIKSKMWRLYNKDKHITQLAMEDGRKFNIPPACFGQAGPSSRETCKIQNKNCLKISIKTIPKCTFQTICNLERRNILFFSCTLKFLIPCILVHRIPLQYSNQIHMIYEIRILSNLSYVFRCVIHHIQGELHITCSKDLLYTMLLCMLYWLCHRTYNKKTFLLIYYVFYFD
jgi:hypothetical protein